MARTVKEFHEIAADLGMSAKRQHDGREAAGLTARERAQAVNVWRRTAHLLSGYANGADVRGRRPTWSAFWDDGLTRDGILALITERSRFNRCDGDGDAPYADDSVIHWEHGLAGELVFTHGLTESPLARNDLFTQDRVGTEYEVTVSLAVAYTGLDIATVRRAVTRADGNRPAYGYATERGGREYVSHPVFDLIKANRPTR